MGTKDIVEKHLEEYDDVFADIVNVLLFGGKPVIKESELENGLTKSQYKADTSEIHEQERDVSKFWKNGLIKIAIYGLENQTAFDRDMPLRVIGYDGQSYRSQLLKTEENTGLEKRYPVVTLVLYFGTRHWEHAGSLYDVLEIPEELKPYVSDYKINVFEIAYLSEEQVGKFTSDFKYVADYFVQMRRDRNYIPSKETMKHVDAVLKIMSVLTNDNRFVEVQNEAKGGLGSMCEVLDRVEKKGFEQGIEQGIEQGKISAYLSMFKDGLITSDTAAQKLGMSEDEFLLLAK